MRIPTQSATAEPRVVGAQETTTDEYLATYRSLVGLQPELTAAVMSEGGASPQRLTFIRKSRGTESHKGGMLARAGEPLDVCFTTWLSGRADRAACTAGAVVPVPDFPVP